MPFAASVKSSVSEVGSSWSQFIDVSSTERVDLNTPGVGSGNIKPELSRVIESIWFILQSQTKFNLPVCNEPMPAVFRFFFAAMAQSLSKVKSIGIRELAPLGKSGIDVVFFARGWRRSSPVHYVKAALRFSLPGVSSHAPQLSQATVERLIPQFMV